MVSYKDDEALKSLKLRDRKKIRELSEIKREGTLDWD
jgi:hypothetical protein